MKNGANRMSSYGAVGRKIEANLDIEAMWKDYWGEVEWKRVGGYLGRLVVIRLAIYL